LPWLFLNAHYNSIGRAKTVAKIYFGVFWDIFFYLIPIALIIPYLLAGNANGQEPA
jgi:hypothetical protein